MITSKNNKIKELKLTIQDYKFKINSLEEILITESQLKQKLQLEIYNGTNVKKLKKLNNFFNY